MLKSSVKKYVGLLVLINICFSILNGCTRLTNSEKKSSIAFNFPNTLQIKNKSNALTSSVILDRLTIQISDPSQNILHDNGKSFIWKRCRTCTNEEAPASITISNISKSKTPEDFRLTQVLAVYKDAINKTYRVYYIDDTRTFFSESISLDLALNEPLFSISDTNMIQVNGRFLTSDNSGPSGTLLTKYTPPSKPSILIYENNIFSGWFNIFLLPDIALSYEVENGPILFNKVNLNSPDFQVSSFISRIEIPENYYAIYNTSSMQSKNGGTMLYGFFGDSNLLNSIGVKTCLMNNNISLQDSTRQQGLYLTNSTDSPLSYIINPLTSGNIGGSTVNIFTGSNCSSSDNLNLFNKVISINVSNLLYMGKESLANYYPPIRFYTEGSGTGPFMPTYDANFSTITSVKYHLLPGIDNSVLDGFLFFKGYNDSIGSLEHQSDGIPCEDLFNGIISGFSQASDIAVSTSDIEYTASFTLSQTEASQGAEVALCPYKYINGIKQFYTSHYMINKNYFHSNGDTSGGNTGNTSSGNGSSTTENPNQLVLLKNLQPYSGMGNSSCTELTLQLQTSSNSPTSYTSNITATIMVSDDLNPTSTQAIIYTSKTDCNSSTNGNTMGIVNLVSGSNSVNFFVRANYNDVGKTKTYSISYSNTPITLSTSSTWSGVVKDYSYKYINFDGPDYILPNVCYPYKITANEYSGYVAYPSSTYTLTLGSTNNTGLFYSDNSCSTILSNNQTTISSMVNSSTIYFKTSLSSGSTLQLTGTSLGLDNGSYNVKVGQGTNNAVKIKIDSSYNSGYYQQCGSTPLSIKFYNENDVAVVSNSSVTVNLFTDSALPGLFYSNNSCSTAALTSISIAGYQGQFYFKPTLGGSGNIRSEISGNPSSQSSFSYSASGPAKAGLGLFGFTNYTTSQDDCIEVKISLLDYLNNAYTYLSTEFSFSLSNFPNNGSSPFYSEKDQDGKCINPTTSSFTMSAQNTTGAISVFYKAYNNTGNSLTISNLTASGAETTTNTALQTSSPIEMTINIRPQLALRDPNTIMTPRELPILAEKLIAVGTGLAPFTYSISSGGGSLTGTPLAFYLPPTSYSTSESLTISDSRLNTLTVDVVSVNKSHSLDFTTDTLPSEVNHSRAASGVATYFNASGVMQMDSTGAARFDHDVSSGCTSACPSKGLLIEGSSTNNLLNSQSIGSWSQSFTTTSSDVSGINDLFATQTVESVVWNNPTYTNMAYVSTQIQNWNTSSRWIASVFVKKNTSRFVGMKIHQSDNVYGYGGIVVDLDTGKAVRMYDTWGCSGTLSENDFGVQTLNNGWYRIWTSYQPQNGSSTGWVFLYPAYHGGTLLSPNRDNTASGSTYFWGAQAEASPNLTSYIPTTTTVVTRPAEEVSLNTSGLSNFNSVFNSLGGTFHFEFSQDGLPASGSNNALPIMRYGDSSNNYFITKIGSNLSWFGIVNSTGTQGTISVNRNLTSAKINKTAFSYSNSNNHSMSINGSSYSTSASGLPSTMTAPTFYLGKDGNGNYLNGHIRKLYYYNNQFIQPVLEGTTSSP